MKNAAFSKINSRNFCVLVFGALLFIELFIQAYIYIYTCNFVKLTANITELCSEYAITYCKIATTNFEFKKRNSDHNIT